MIYDKALQHMSRVMRSTFPGTSQAAFPVYPCGLLVAVFIIPDNFAVLLVSSVTYYSSLD